MLLEKSAVPVPLLVDPKLLATVGLAAVSQTTPFAVIDVPPSVTVLPPEVALVLVMAEVELVLNAAVPPKVVPEAVGADDVK